MAKRLGGLPFQLYRLLRPLLRLRSGLPRNPMHNDGRDPRRSQNKLSIDELLRAHGTYIVSLKLLRGAITAQDRKRYKILVRVEAMQTAEGVRIGV